MKVINDLLGLAVLTSPLWLIVCFAVVGIWIAVIVTRRLRSTAAKAVVGVCVVALALILPFADEISGRIYLRHLCSTEAGVKVYQTVELPAEYWDAVGRPKFYDERNGNFHLRKEYRSELKIEKYSLHLHIDKRIWTLLNSTRDKNYAEAISFMYWGGWLRREFSANNSAVPCGNDLERSREFMRQAFKLAESK